MKRWICILASIALTLGACHREQGKSGGPSGTTSATSAKRYVLPTGGTSIYPLGTSLTDQNEQPAKLDVFAGHPVVISMFYSSCTTACPLMVRDVKRIEAALRPATRADLRVLLVSFDPERDNPAALRDMAEAHAVDQTRWRLTRTSQDETRTLAAVLGIQYRKVAPGEYSHSVVISVLDRKGVIVAHREGLEAPIDELVEAIEAVEAAPSG